MGGVCETFRWIAWRIVLVGVTTLLFAGQAVSESSDIDLLLNRLATGSDAEATAALLELDADPGWFLEHYGQVADAVLNATGSLEPDRLVGFLPLSHYSDTPFEKFLRYGEKVERRELLLFWVAERIRSTPTGEEKEAVLEHFLGRVEGLLGEDGVTPEQMCNLLTSFRHSIFYPFAMFVVPQQGSDLAIDLYLKHLEHPSELVAKEVYRGLCRMAFCVPARQVEVRGALIEAYPGREQALQIPGYMSLTIPSSSAPIEEAEYISLRGMSAERLVDVLRSQRFPRAGNTTEFIVMAFLKERAERGDESTYKALFSLGKEVSDSPIGLDMIAATMGRGASTYITDEEKADRILWLVERQVQQSREVSKAIRLAVMMLHETYIAGVNTAREPVPGTERAIQALLMLSQQSVADEQESQIQSLITRLRDLRDSVEE